MDGDDIVLHCYELN